MPKTTDYILIQATLDAASVPTLADAGAKLCAQSPVPMNLHRIAWSEDAKTVYCYARLGKRTALDDQALPALAALFQGLCPGARDARVSRLECVFETDGYSRAEAPVFHYVVEMDPADGWMSEIARWYDTEHMPGLAAVPGCIHATRLINHDHGPVSHAYYELLTPQTLGSRPWLAIRWTHWSDIVRPHFTNTKRTMFGVIA
jgi:hypothetical protein